MSNIINFNGITTHDIPADRVLKGALVAELEGVVVIGYDKDGELHCASSYADGGAVLWLLEQCKRILLGY